MSHPVGRYRDSRALRGLHHQCGHAWRKFRGINPANAKGVDTAMATLYKTIKDLDGETRPPRVNWPKWRGFKRHEENHARPITKTREDPPDVLVAKQRADTPADT